jgi:putative hydrolase of the HAD superfamily
MKSVGLTFDAVLFDMGYTLVYFDPPQETIVQTAMHASGVPLSVEQIQRATEAVWGRYYEDAETATFPATPEYDAQTQRELGLKMLAQLGLEGDESTLQSYADAIESEFDRPGTIRPYPEVRSVLDALQERGLRLGILSNWSWNLRDRVAQAGLDGYFELIWASAYAGRHKPHPEIFHQALTKMGISPEDALYVGDSYWHDIVGARGAGLSAVLVDREGTTDDPDWPVIRDLRGLLELLEA